MDNKFTTKTVVATVDLCAQICVANRFCETCPFYASECIAVRVEKYVQQLAELQERTEQEASAYDGEIDGLNQEDNNAN